MIGVREEGETDVREDKVLGKEVDQLEELLGPPPRAWGHVDVGVVGLHDAAEQHRHDPWECTRWV